MGKGILNNIHEAATTEYSHEAAGAEAELTTISIVLYYKHQHTLDVFPFFPVCKMVTGINKNIGNRL